MLFRRLVCSDLIARGMDIEQVTHVFNYDSPMDMVKYVHRVGRTARAGRSGEAWTLVEPQEANPFKAMLSRANHLDALKKAKVTEKDLDPLLHAYEVGSLLSSWSARLTFTFHTART